MGGIGSGEWWRWNAKKTTDDFLALDVSKLSRDGVLSSGACGVLEWTNTNSASVSYKVLDEGEDLLSLQLRYHIDDSHDTICLPILLQTTRPNFGGKRWWFTCPLITHGMEWNRR